MIFKLYLFVLNYFWLSKYLESSYGTPQSFCFKFQSEFAFVKKKIFPEKFNSAKAFKS